MANVMTLLLVLLGSVVERSDAVSCYDCQYNSLQPQQATCTKPFDAESAPKCNGTVCEFTYQSVNASQNREEVSRSCTSQLIYHLDNCTTNNKHNYYFFTQGSNCCYSISGISHGATVQNVTCQCQADNCNDYIPIPEAKTTDLHPTPADSMGISIAGFSLLPVSKLSIVFVAMIAVP